MRNVVHNRKMKILTSIFLLISLMTNAQEGIWKKYYINNGLCSESLKLYMDSTYFYETGCEERSYINIGRWTIFNDTIQLKPIDTLNFNCLMSITQNTNIYKDSIILRVIDINDQPIKGFDVIYVPSTIEYKLINDPGEYTFVEKNKKDITLKSIETDDKGLAKLKGSESGSVLLVDLTQIFGKNLVIKKELFKSHSITIKLNLRQDAFLYHRIKWIDLKFLQLENSPDELTFIKE